MSIQQLFLIIPLCPFATCDLGGVTPVPPMRLKWPVPIDGMLICRVAQWIHTAVALSQTSFCVVALGLNPLLRPWRDNHPRRSPSNKPYRISSLVTTRVPDDYDTIITSSYNTCDDLFERFTIGCALSRFSPGSSPARLILGAPLLGSPPGHHHAIMTSSSAYDRASDKPLERALGVRGST